MNANQLNAAAAPLNTSDKNVVFAACVKALVSAGFTVDAALDAVCGKGTYDNLVSDLYDQLNA